MMVRKRPIAGRPTAIASSQKPSRLKSMRLKRIAALTLVVVRLKAGTHSALSYPDDVSNSLALFETPVGACAIAWSDAGITGLQLPEGSAAATRARAVRRYAAVERLLSSAAQDAVDRIRALLDGQPDDLSSIVLDMHGVPAFNQRVYELARRIPPGRTLTYGDIASRLGGRGVARAV